MASSPKSRWRGEDSSEAVVGVPPPGPPPLPGSSGPERRPVATPAAEPAGAPTGASTGVPTGAVIEAEADEFRDLLNQWTAQFGEWLQAIYRESPAWLVSFVFHSILLVVLGLIAISGPKNELLVVQLGETETSGEQLDDEMLQQEDLNVEIDTPELSFDPVPVNDPLAAMPEIELAAEGITAPQQIDAKSLGSALSGRSKGAKAALLAKYGGNATTEAAVMRALEWLVRNQERDGSWRLNGPYKNGGITENRTAATAMALLAFQGAGHTHLEGRFSKQVARGWRALTKMQDAEGNFYHDRSTHQHLYSQAQATIAICELYGMTKDSKFRDRAQLAVDYAVRTQNRDGGWRYQPYREADTSVTGWFLMALQSAKMAGLEVPDKTFERLSRYLDKVATNRGSQFVYQIDKRHTSMALTAEGLLCRQYLGWKRDDARLRRGVRLISNNPISFRGNRKNVYYWYYATQVLHHMEGEPWEQWNKVMRVALPEQQVKRGRERGSWDPTGDTWGELAGRLYVTCLCTYSLEVYYRHLPIYRSAGE